MAYTRKSKSSYSRRKTRSSSTARRSTGVRRRSTTTRRSTGRGSSRSSGQTIRIVVEQMSAQNPLAQNPQLQTTTTLKRAAF